jgi:hypothetical protein
METANILLIICAIIVVGLVVLMLDDRPPGQRLLLEQPGDQSPELVRKGQKIEEDRRRHQEH